MVINEELIDKVWAKGVKVPGYSETQIKKDACGAWIRRDAYGNHESPFGWEIDHIFPQKKLSSFNVPQSVIDCIQNLRPLQWANNLSKGTDYPSYRAKIKADGLKNVEQETFFTVNQPTQSDLNQIFDKYLR